MQTPFRFEFKHDSQKRLVELKKTINTLSIKELNDETLRKRLFDQFKYLSVSFENEKQKIRKEIILRIVPDDPKKGEQSQLGRKAIAVVQYWIPRTSESFLSLEFRPDPYAPDLSGEAKSIKYDQDNIQFEIPTRHNKIKISDEVIEEVKERKKCLMSFLEKNTDNLNKNILSFNESLEEMIDTEITSQLEELEEIEEIKERL